MAISVRLCWFASVLSHRVKIDSDVGNPALAHLDRKSCSSRGGGSAVIGFRRLQVPDQDQAADSSDSQADDEVSRPVVPGEKSCAPPIRGPGPQPLGRGPQPEAHVTSCPFRCKAVSPSKLADPRTSDSPSESIHRATTSASLRVTNVRLPAHSTLPEARATPILARLASTNTLEFVGPYVARARRAAPATGAPSGRRSLTCTHG